jgi:hypothetical protein
MASQVEVDVMTRRFSQVSGHCRSWAEEELLVIDDPEEVKNQDGVSSWSRRHDSTLKPSLWSLMIFPEEVMWLQLSRFICYQLQPDVVFLSIVLTSTCFISNQCEFLINSIINFQCLSMTQQTHGCFNSWVVQANIFYWVPRVPPYQLVTRF